MEKSIIAQKSVHAGLVEARAPACRLRPARGERQLAAGSYHGVGNAPQGFFQRRLVCREADAKAVAPAECRSRDHGHALFQQMQAQRLVRVGPSPPKRAISGAASTMQ
jgi:hypothetical protein